MSEFTPCVIWLSNGIGAIFMCTIFKKALPIFIVSIVADEKSVLSTEKNLAGYAIP